MSAEKKTADSFGIFLEAVRGKNDGTSDDPGLRLLGVLAETGPATASDLFDKAGLDLTSFATAFKAVQDSGFAISTGTAENEMLELTESGRTVASRAR